MVPTWLILSATAALFHLAFFLGLFLFLALFLFAFMLRNGLRQFVSPLP